MAIAWCPYLFTAASYVSKWRFDSQCLYFSYICQYIIFWFHFFNNALINHLNSVNLTIMAEQARSATPAESTVTLVESEDDHVQQDVHTVRLRLRKPKPKKKVQWRAGTVDNEHMNKKKSKCCCQYEKPRAFGESSSESDDECENCHGHVERKKKTAGVAGGSHDATEPVESTSN